MSNYIKFITDSACDIPDEDLKKWDIEMLSFPMVVDGIEYQEREDVNFEEYYKMLENSKEIPKTSRITEPRFISSYKKAFSQGYKHVVAVTINAGGSGTFEAATMARDMFYKQYPEAAGKMQIHLIDSKTYSMAYGIAILKAAEKAKEQEPIEDILSFLDDWFESLEIYAGCYTLKYAQKSGRIHFATAFVGELLGMRPIISLIANKTETVSKIRGEKNIPTALLKVFKEKCENKNGTVIVLHGKDETLAEELVALLKKEYKLKPSTYNVGAAIATNIGPNVVGLVFTGTPRNK